MSLSLMDPTTDYGTDNLMQNLGTWALFLGILYIVVTFIVWRGVRRVFRDVSKWNTLKLFCLSLVIVPILRAAAFILHFLIYEGNILSSAAPPAIKNVIMNSFYIVPTFLFIFTYMVLICIWIEITMFSRDQYLIQHDRYGKIWKWVYGIVTVVILSGLIFIFSYGIIRSEQTFLNALYTALYAMTFFIPVCAFTVWIILVIRFAGFPYLNDVWKQQTKRMFYVVLVWTIGEIISGIMTSVWSINNGNWMASDNYLWFALSLALTLVFSEILPLIYTSDWQRMGFLLMAFVNWRDLWLRDQSRALVHDPKLIDDPMSKANNNPNSSALEFKPFMNQKQNYNSLARTLLSTNTSPYNSPTGVSLQPPLDNIDTTTPTTTSAAVSRDQLNTSINFKKLLVSGKINIDFNKLKIDRNLIIPNHIYNDCNSYFTTHRAKLRKAKTSVSKSKSITNPNTNSSSNSRNNLIDDDTDDDDDDDYDEYDFCLKIFDLDNIDSSMISQIMDNLNKYKKLKHDNLGILYGIHSNMKLKQLSLLSPWYAGGSLFDIIDMSPKHTPFAMHVIRRMILQISIFMHWLHNDCNIFHGYLKSRNILFDNEMNVCITDIGLISLKKTMTILLPNANYDGYWNDKDYFEGKPIKKECDVYAFGFILYELITKKQPFNGSNNNIDDIKKCITTNTNMPKIPKHCSDIMKKLILSCWEPNRTKRPTFQNIITIIKTKL